MHSAYFHQLHMRITTTWQQYEQAVSVLARVNAIAVLDIMPLYRLNHCWLQVHNTAPLLTQRQAILRSSSQLQTV
jgi:hypothetical protein